MTDSNNGLNKLLNQAPPQDQERDAFVTLNPSGFFVRHPPPPHELDAFLTHDDCLFQTIHMGAAEVSMEKWMLVFDGLVEHSFVVNLHQLRSMPSKTVTSFHECYGSPLMPPTKALRRVGNVEWTGVPLHILLAKAQPKAEARFVWSEGLDRGKFGGVEADRYQKDLPIDKALGSEVLIAYEMNGQALSKNRGGPVRLVVPGWFGTNSTKWLSKLSVQENRAPGPFTTVFYNETHPPDDPTCVSRPIWEVQPNSMIVRPAPGSSLVGPSIAVEGWAWSKNGVKNVKVSVDEGTMWKESELDERKDFSWQRFRVAVRLPPGTHTIMARATSPRGRSQPLGEGRNHVHRVTIDMA